MSRFRALRSHDFRLLFFGQLVSLTGTQMQHVAVAWQLYMLTRSPLSLGLIGFFRVTPVILLALGGGVVADALDRRRLMLLTQSSLAIASLVLAVMTATGRTSPAAIYTVLFFSGAALAFEIPARQSLIPLLVPREDLPNALSLNAVGWTTATIAGPAIAGFVIDRYGVAPIYIADVASFIAVIGALLAMRHRAPAPGTGAISFAAALDGFRFLRGSPLILATMLLDFVATFFAGSMLLMPIFADQLLDVGARGLGILYAAQPAGAALTAAVLSLRPAIRSQGRTLLASVIVYGAAITVFGVSPWLWLSMLMLAISGAADTVSTVIRQTIRQLATPDELRGRVTSMNMIFFIGGPQLGEVEAGIVAKAFGARVSVSSGGLLCVIATIAVAVLLPSLRRHRHPEQPARGVSAG
jgi:MFS family permease